MSKIILLVEDDPFLNSLLKTRLTNEGFTVLNAADGDQALEMMKKEKLDLVLMDLILPKKSGFEVLEAVKEDPKAPKVPAIIISNLGQEEDIIRGKELGAIEYYVKAKTSIDDLVSKIKEHVEGKNG